MNEKQSMPSLRTPAFTAAVGVFAMSSLALCAHLFAYWVFLSGRMWPHAFRQQLVMTFCALGILALLMLAAGVARLLRRAFHVWWAGAVLWSLASVASGLWMLTALLPVARRLGNRRALRFAAWGGAVFLLSVALAVAGCFMPVSWPMLLVGVAGAFLALSALQSLDGGARPHRLLAGCFVLVVIAALAMQPAFHVGRVSREADAALAELLETVAPPVDPVTMYPGKPPVPEAEDPVAALDPEAIEKERASWQKLVLMLKPCDNAPRRHPPTEDELAAITRWFATHTNLTTAANAMTAAPGYRSCLPGRTSADEVMENLFFEPRSTIALPVARSAIHFFARMMHSAGDGAVGPDAFRRLKNLESIFEGEPTLIPFLLACAIRSMNLDLIEERIDLWKVDDLFEFLHLAEDAPAWAEGRARTAQASESLWTKAIFERELSFGQNTRGKALIIAMSGSGALECWLTLERRACHRHALIAWREINRILKADAGPAIGEEIRSFVKDEGLRGEALPPLAAETSGGQGVVLKMLISWRERASFVRTAIAVERFRRAHAGELPPSLDALVPEYLPEVPRSLYTGEPLHYEPGPIEIPEETFPALRDPDGTTAKSTAKQMYPQQSGDALDDGSGGRGQGTRTLPAQTLPGFRLVLTDGLGRNGRGRAIDFLLGTKP